MLRRVVTIIATADGNLLFDGARRGVQKHSTGRRICGAGVGGGENGRIVRFESCRNAAIAAANYCCLWQVAVMSMSLQWHNNL